MKIACQNNYQQLVGRIFSVDHGQKRKFDEQRSVQEQSSIFMRNCWFFGAAAFGQTVNAIFLYHSITNPKNSIFLRSLFGGGVASGGRNS